MLGSLVRSQTNSLGVGKLLGVSGQEAEVEYFKSVGERVRKTVKVSDLKRVRLGRQTRCYLNHREDGRWGLGRIGFHDKADNTYEVHLPDGIAPFVPESQIYVRCAEPVDDPTETLILKGHETAYFNELRAPFVQCLIGQRAAARGMTGLISSNIDLYPHQVEVARRVLEDPVQRYLLADEVGLGKTIEAGIILRQYLLDEPNKKALVFVPALLKRQWKSELADKFGLSDAEPRVCVAATEELDSLGDFNLSNKLGLIILDEAHHIAVAAYSASDKLRRRFEVCRRLAHQSPGLLLLSATPALNNEQAFLAMLHLLDPTAYRLDDLEAFKDRVDKRQDVGRLLLSFYEGAYTVALKKSSAKLRETFPSDARLAGLLDELEPLLVPVSDESLRNALIRTVRVHVSDSYRLHRRMLRNRREAVELIARLSPEQRQADLKEECDVDERAEKVQALLDEWRVGANQHVGELRGQEPDGATGAEGDLKTIFSLLFRSSGTWLGLLKGLLTARLAGEIDSDLLHDFTVEDLRVLCKTPRFPGEEAILSYILRVLDAEPDDGDRIDTLVQALHLHRAAGSKAVVFTSYTNTANELSSRLGQALGERSTVTHGRGRPLAQIEEDLLRFREDQDCFVMICDSSGEEGRNLQFADWVIHFDLPASPNRLEQRIGRLDRIGRTRGVRSRVFIGPDVENGLHDAWYQLLKDGLNIFERSVAGLQFYIDRKFPELERTLFRSGAAGIVDAIPLVRKEIEEEQVRVNEQNALDEIDSSEEGAAGNFEALVAYDSSGDMIKRATEGWVCHALHFRRRGNDVIRYKPEDDTLVPANILLEMDIATSLAGMYGTYSRELAVKKTGVTLLRVGNPFINAMADYVRWDDRGQAFAIWRQIPDLNTEWGSEWLGFRFDLIAEADLDETRQVLKDHRVEGRALRSLERRCDGLFPPQIHTVFINSEMGAVDDPAILEVLRLPFSKAAGSYRDYNLTKSRVAALESLVDQDQWGEMCRSAKASAVSLLRESETFREECSTRGERAERELGLRVDQLRMRLSRAVEDSQFEASSLEKELDVESALYSAVVRGVRNPRIRIDAAGFYVISGRAPATA